MPCTIPYFKAVGIALDQLANAALTRGWPDETFSSRCHRWRLKGIRWPAAIVDTILFWDKENGKRHCELSFESERQGRQLPPELRK